MLEEDEASCSSFWKTCTTPWELTNVLIQQLRFKNIPAAAVSFLKAALQHAEAACIAQQQQQQQGDDTTKMFFVYTSKTHDRDIPSKESLTHLRVDSSVTEIPEGFFQDSEMKGYALVHLQLPKTLKRIGECAFQYCSNLKFIEFFDSRNDEEASSSCLEEGLIVFPEESTTSATRSLQIDSAAFCGCESLRKVVFPSASTRLGLGVFGDCSGLISVELPRDLQDRTVLILQLWIINNGQDAFLCDFDL
eukprot:scaffold5039_cov119-Cylindrotheca_fusiformis.AAC.8